MARWFFYFLFYSFAGYCLEKLFARVTRAPKQVRKCFLFLPLCPVYGLAMVAVVAVVPPDTALPRLFLSCAVICTAVEYLVHLFYDRIFRVEFWDYAPLPGNIGGRICPQFSAAWGVLAGAAVRWVQPAAAAVQIPREAVYTVWLLLAADCVCTAFLLLGRHDTELLTLSAVLAQMRAESQSSTS
ncbi:MAG: putative ABC transporter permease [Oscillospiraceae bacterium]|nr:putative ABC transporter permease [Oscillospiraceae bacterium]